MYTEMDHYQRPDQFNAVDLNVASAREKGVVLARAPLTRARVH